MHCIERRAAVGWRRGLLGLTAIAAVLSAGCAGRPASSPATPGVPTPITTPTPEPAAPRVDPAADGPVRLPAPGAVRSVKELELQAARRIAAANPHLTYSGRVPDVLLAIPVLEVDLNGDGSIRRIEVMRYPRQAKDTTQIAIDAVRRAAPFGDVSKLPRPWRFAETFLFNDERRFKPRTLDDR